MEQNQSHFTETSHPQVRAKGVGRDKPALLYQRWKEMVFLHWPVDPIVVQRTIPSGLTVDQFEGRAYVGVVAFNVDEARPRFSPALPWLSQFHQVNFRTYVSLNGRPGVWFYCLHINRLIPTLAARFAFDLPFVHSRVDGGEIGDVLNYSLSTSTNTRMTLSAEHEEEPFLATPDSLEFFLAERYLLFRQKRAQFLTGRVAHRPYILHRSSCREWNLSGFDTSGCPLPDTPPPHVMYSPGVRAEIYPLFSD